MPNPTALHLRRTIGATAVGTIALFTVVSCSSNGSEPAPSSTTAPTSTTAAATSTTGSNAPTTTEPAEAEGDTAAWAAPFVAEGDLLTSIEGTGFRVDVHQVGTVAAPDDGNFVDPDTNEPILKAGDELVFVNYVFTNTGDEAIPLSYSLVDVEARYADWPWLQGMDGASDRDLFEQMGVLASALDPDAGDAPFAWEPGTTFAMGDNFAYQPGSAITFEARLTPADEEGDLVHDERQEIEAETTIR